jgi:hypothetical protein
MSSFYFPLSFDTGTTEREVTINIQGKSYILYFNLNTIEISPDYNNFLSPFSETANNLYMSCYSINKSIIYFGSLRCVTDRYINNVDNGLPYKFFFIDTSGKNYKTVTFDAITNGVNLYCTAR